MCENENKNEMGEKGKSSTILFRSAAWLADGIQRDMPNASTHYTVYGMAITATSSF